MTEDNTRLRSLLAALADVGPPVDDQHSRFACCAAWIWEAHKPDCPWLLAKQYLEPTPQDATGRAESHQEPR